MNPDYFQDQIPDYLDGLLNEKARSAFESELSVNQALRASLALAQRIQSALPELKGMDEDMAFIESLTELPEAQNSNAVGHTDSQPRRLNTNYIAIAGLILMVVLTIIVLWPRDSKKSKLPAEPASVERTDLNTVNKLQDSDTTPIQEKGTKPISPNSSANFKGINDSRSSPKALDLQEEQNLDDSLDTQILFDTLMVFADFAGKEFLDELLPDVMGPSEPDSILRQAIVSQDYQKALERLSSLNIDLNPSQILAKGYMLLCTSNFTDAMIDFEAVSTPRHFLQRPSAEFLKLVVLATDWPNSKSDFLAQKKLVSTFGEPYAQRAQELLDILP